MTELSNLEHHSPHGELRTAFYNPYDIKRRRRTTPSQFKTLERAFSENPKPNASTRELLAARLSMTPRGIQVWFQNRRAKNKQANTATHQTNTNPSTDDQPLEGSVGPESDPPLVRNESGPAHAESSSIHPPLTLTIKCFNALGEPPTTKMAQATTRSDSVTSQFSSSVLSVESVAVKTDSTHFPHSPDDNGSALDTDSTWSRSQLLSGANAHRPLANLQLHHAVPALPFSSPSLSALGPTAPQLLNQPRQNISTPVITRKDWSPGAPQKSQDTSMRRNSKTITFQELPTTAPTILAAHRRPSTLSLLRRMSMPASMRMSSDQERGIWSGQHSDPSMDNLQQTIPHQQTSPYPVNANSNNTCAQPSPFPPHLPPQPQSSRTLPSNVTSPAATMAAMSATTAVMGGTHLPPTTFGNMVFSSDSRGYARTYPLSRRVSIHETSFSSSHLGSRHKAVHSLDGLSSTSILDGTGQTESITVPIEVQSKRRKSVSKHFRPSGGSPVAGMHVFDTSGGVTHGDSPSSFSASPTSVNVPSFTFSPPGQQPRIANTQVSRRATASTNSHSTTERQVLPDPKGRVEWMEGINLAQQQSLPEGGADDRANLSMASISDCSSSGGVSYSTQQGSNPTMGLSEGHLSTQNLHTLAGQGITIAQGSVAAAGGETSSFGGALDPRKGRRRSSLKTTPRKKSISGARVQFDMQNSTGTSVSVPAGQDSLVQPMQQGSFGAGESVYQDTWMSKVMQQKHSIDNISSGDNTEGSSAQSSSPMAQKHSSSPRPPDAFDRLGQEIVLSSSATMTAESGFMDQDEAVYWPTAADFAQAGRSGQDSTALDPALLLDSPQSRRNSCPPGLIESFKKDLQIITDHTSLSNRPPLNQEDVAVLQLQQQLEHNLQLQQHQQRQQYLQQQIQQQLQHQRQQQQLQQQQQFQQQQHLFFPVQEISSATPESSSSSSTLPSKADIGTGTWQEQPFGIVFPDGHIAERRERGIGSSMLADSLATLDQESRVLDTDTQEQEMMFQSGSGHRYSLTDPYHLPQLQTPRLLAQQQHQVEQPPWSRARAAHNVRPPRSRLSLPVTLQDTHGRRFSEPCNKSKDLSGMFNNQQGADLLLDGDDLSSSTPMTDLYQWQSNQESSLHGTSFTTSPTLPVKAEETPLSKSLHPLEASASDVQDFDQSTMLLPAFTTSSSNLSATSVLGQHMPVYSFPCAMTASPASSISSSPSPSSSPLASRDMREFPYGSATSSSPMSDNGPSTYGGPSPPVWGTPSSVAMAIALSPSIEAPLLMRTHSLDSLMIQQNSARESLTTQADPNASLTSPRRHSQGPSSTVSADHVPQAHTPLSSQYPQHELLQTQQQQSYFPLPVFAPPLPLSPLSPNTSKSPLSVHPLDQHSQQQHLQQLQQQQQHQQQQQYFVRQGRGWNAAFPGMFPSPQPLSPLAMQRSQQSDTSSQGGSPTIVLPSERLQQTINWEQNLAAMNHFAILQQKLPLARQQQQLQDSQNLLHAQVQSTHQQLYLQQLQQQQQQLHQQSQQNHSQQQLLDKQQQQTTLQDQQQQALQPQVLSQVQAPLQQHRLQEQAPLSLPLTPAPLVPEQLSMSPTHSFAPDPALAVPSFKDAKDLENYKHQQFILEHQRLQQRQEFELEALKVQSEVKLDQKSKVTLQDGSQQQPDRSLGSDTSTAMARSGAIMANRLTGHTTIATALVPPSSSMLSPSALKDS